MSRSTLLINIDPLSSSPSRIPFNLGVCARSTFFALLPFSLLRKRSRKTTQKNTCYNYQTCVWREKKSKDMLITMLVLCNLCVFVVIKEEHSFSLVVVEAQLVVVDGAITSI